MKGTNKMGLDNTDRTILVGDDDSEVRDFLEVTLRHQGYGVHFAEDGDQVLNHLESQVPFSAVMLDIYMPGKNGFDVLKAIRSKDRDLPVIMLSGASSPENIVAVMKKGANDFLGKPFSSDDVHKALRSVFEGRPSPAKAPASPERPRIKAQDTQHSFGNWSLAVQELYAMASAVGPTDTPVLIQGETGVGKEVLARQLHSLSRRAHKPFFKLNCAALPSELVESELFGYERGAFTGAFQRKPGMFELADGGTLLLDEIGDMDFKLQAKLLQVLQDHEFQRLGGKETIRVDVRVIAATHNDLEKAIVLSKFRQDLFYRLNVVALHVPALRERKDDILPLAKILLEKHSPAGAPRLEITQQLQQALLLHDWPGNIRELENVIRKLIVLRDPQLISRDLTDRAARKSLNAVPASSGGTMESVPLSAPILEQVRRAKHQAETEAILAALTSTQWNRKKAASLLKIDYKAMLYKMKKLGIESKVAVLPETEEVF
jgi:two-component system response regulator AtoC